MSADLPQPDSPSSRTMRCRFTRLDKSFTSRSRPTSLSGPVADRTNRSGCSTRLSGAKRRQSRHARKRRPKKNSRRDVRGGGRQRQLLDDRFHAPRDHGPKRPDREDERDDRLQKALDGTEPLPQPRKVCHLTAPGVALPVFGASWVGQAGVKALELQAEQDADQTW
jgi:hypothetical protein